MGTVSSTLKASWLPHTSELILIGKYIDLLWFKVLVFCSPVPRFISYIYQSDNKNRALLLDYTLGISGPSEKSLSCVSSLACIYIRGVVNTQMHTHKSKDCGTRVSCFRRKYPKAARVSCVGSHACFQICSICASGRQSGQKRRRKRMRQQYLRANANTPGR